MKKSVLTQLDELKAVLDKGETIVFELHRINKPVLKFTITQESIKGVFYTNKTITKEN